MKYNYQHKITFELNEPFDINYIKNVCNQYPNSRILVEVQNTKGITSSMIRQLSPNISIRIAGGYDTDRIRRHGNIRFKNGETGEYYTSAVIYTRNETIKILEEIERIESGLNINWSDIQKLLYVYDRLKTGIMYDPKFEHKVSSEIRSLRGLITKQAVCAGYAMILKEFMDRNGIDCEYVEGHTKIEDNGERTGGHAWNIVNIDGKKYPIDLTWDNTIFRSGNFNTFDWLGKDIVTFSYYHHPMSGEKTQDYKHTLTQIDPKIVRQLYAKTGIGKARDYRSTTYYGTRKDGSKFIVAQIGNTTINNQKYYRYYFQEVLANGKKNAPLILYSETNVAYLINSKNFNEPIPPNYEETVDSILFSRENIKDSLNKHTFYIGKVRKGEDKKKFELVTSYQEIYKPEEKRNLFVYPTRRFTRSDGSAFIAQQMFDTPHKANGIDVMRYDIFEMVNENGRDILKRNTIYTERDFFKDTRQSMVDDYLSRERLDRKVHEAGGYIGYYDANGIRTYNPNLVDFFKNSKKIDVDQLNKQKTKTNSSLKQIPTFSELKELALKYEIFFDSKDPLESDTSKIKIRNIKTGQIQTDQSIINKAMFANIWLTSAGVKYEENESRPGENYAFNEPAYKLYNTICKQLLISCKNKGVIDTVDLLRNIEKENTYKHSIEIVVNLFRTQFQTEIINKLFLQALEKKQTHNPEPLYSMSYAGELAFNEDSYNSKSR